MSWRRPSLRRKALPGCKCLSIQTFCKGQWSCFRNFRRRYTVSYQHLGTWKTSDTTWMLSLCRALWPCPGIEVYRKAGHHGFWGGGYASECSFVAGGANWQKVMRCTRPTFLFVAQFDVSSCYCDDMFELVLCCVYLKALVNLRLVTSNHLFKSSRKPVPFSSQLRTSSSRFYSCA